MSAHPKRTAAKDAVLQNNQKKVEDTPRVRVSALPCDLLVTQPLGEQDQDLPLAHGQVVLAAERGPSSL